MTRLSTLRKHKTREKRVQERKDIYLGEGTHISQNYEGEQDG